MTMTLPPRRLSWTSWETRRGWLLAGFAPATTATSALLVLLTVLGAIVVAAAVWLRRRPALEPDAAFRGIVAVASRFGYGRQPDQTPYEYTASLSRVVPGVAVELQTVARAKDRMGLVARR